MKINNVHKYDITDLLRKVVNGGVEVPRHKREIAFLAIRKIQELRGELTAVKVELASAKKDAARYIYWRDNHGWTGYFDDGASNSEDNNDIDNSIDVAMNKETKHE